MFASESSQVERMLGLLKEGAFQIAFAGPTSIGLAKEYASIRAQLVALIRVVASQHASCADEVPDSNDVKIALSTSFDGLVKFGVNSDLGARVLDELLPKAIAAHSKAAEWASSHLVTTFALLCKTQTPDEAEPDISRVETCATLLEGLRAAPNPDGKLEQIPCVALAYV
jgi:hypothetical protein